jgi:hypothetical protein
MPPVNQGSRAALVTWTVITSIAFVVSLVFAIYWYVEADRLRESLASQQRQYERVVRPAELTGEEIQRLTEAATQEGPIAFDRNDTALQVALKQRNALVQRITGSPERSANEAVATAQSALATARQRVEPVGVQIPADNLAGAIDRLSSAVVARQQEAEGLRQQLEEAKRANARTIEQTQAQLKAMEQTIEQIRGEQTRAVQASATDRRSKDEQIASLQRDFERQQRLAQEAAAAAAVQVADLQRQLAQVEQERDALQARLADVRIDPSRATIQQVDGRILRVPSADLVFIDLGRGQQVTPGLTFEVYDKNEGVPNLGELEDDRALSARGKASIEVIRVGATSSEARVVRRTPGAQITEGDFLVNLIYDPNTRYSFYVHGDFDLNRDGVASPGDAEVIRRLITQWGGQVTDVVNVDTDFVVLGREPQIPEVARDELETNPILRAQYDRAIQELENYQEIVAQARSYRIPVLNQNRFLYMVGYYAQARR